MPSHTEAPHRVGGNGSAPKGGNRGDEEVPVVTNDQERRTALGHFLRTRRARILPETAGLPVSQRRRTPGLRREELALIADISATWYMWLEQGRPINVSEQVLDRLAQALRLNTEERTHLYMLARGHEPATDPVGCQIMTPAVRATLAHLDPCPAFVHSPCFSVLAWNRAAAAVLTDFDAVPDYQRNWLRLLFLSEDLRARMADWPGEARRALALFRANSRRYVGAEGMEAIVQELHRSCAEFRLWWGAHEVLGGGEMQTRIDHPQAGMLTFETVTYLLAQAPEERLVVFTPVGAETEERLGRLLSGEA